MAAFEAKKASIRKAAKKVFAKYGYHKTTLDDIARVIGIKKNSLYYYYESKESLFNSILIELTDYFLSDLKKSIATRDSAIEKLKCFIFFSIEHKGKHEEINEATLSALNEIGEVIEQSYTEFIEKAMVVCRGIIEEGIESGEFRKVDPIKLSHHIYSTVSAYEYKFYHQLDQIELMANIDRTKLREELEAYYEVLKLAVINN